MDGDNRTKVLLIPDDSEVPPTCFRRPVGASFKGPIGPPGDELASYQLVGEVMAHQGDDG